ncbi:MAG: lipid asymmetry maintenance protein MlaB [Vibrio sp.]
MTEAALVATWQQDNESSASIIGPLTRDTVPMLWTKLKQWQPSVERFDLSLQQLERVDSAGMAMLIHLLQHAKNKNCLIMLSFMPNQLKTLFELSNIDDLIVEHIQKTED